MKDLKKGERLTTKNMRSIRPGNGLAPRDHDAALGRRAKVDIARGTPLSWDLLEKARR